MNLFTFLCHGGLKTNTVIAGLCLLFSISFFGALITWFTHSYDNFVLSQLVLNNNSEAFKLWRKPSVRAVYNVYIFNYTNVEDYKNGVVDKFHLQELGPYAYQEELERVDISFPTEDTISFREKRILTFRPDLSKGRQIDRVVVPNLAVLSGSAVAKPQNYFNRLAFSGLLSGMDEEAFLTTAAESYITGYKDRLYDLARNFLPYETPEKIGVAVSKIGISPHHLTINTGKHDIDQLAIYEKFNGREELDFFSGPSCSSIAGTDGALHSPIRVHKKEPIYYLMPEFCRRMPLVFSKEIKVLDGKVTAYQYTHPDDVFDSADEKPENGCFCNIDSAQCPLKGLFNVSNCNYGSPAFISHPHFHRADPILLKHFTGLHPERTTYNTYFNVHPTMGFVMSARNPMQVNVQVQKGTGVSQLEMFEDGMILPVAWLEGVLDDKTLPKEVVDTINLVTFTVPSVELALKYGSLLTAIITLISLIIVLRRTSSPTIRIVPERLIRTGQGYYEAS